MQSPVNLLHANLRDSKCFLGHPIYDTHLAHIVTHRAKDAEAEKKGKKKMQRLARGVLNVKKELLIEGFEVLDQPGVERT